MTIPQQAQQNRELSPIEMAYKRISWLALMQIVRDNDHEAVKDGYHRLFCEIVDREPTWFENGLESFVEHYQARSKNAGKSKTLEGIEEGKEIRARFYEYLEQNGKTHFVQIAKDFPDFEKRKLNYRLGYMRKLGMIKNEGRVWEAVAPEADREKSSRKIIMEYLQEKGDWVTGAVIIKEISELGVNRSTLSCSLTQLTQEGRILKNRFDYKYLDKAPDIK